MRIDAYTATEGHVAVENVKAECSSTAVPGMGGVRIGNGGVEMKLKTLNENILIRSN